MAAANAFVGFVHEPGVFERIASNYYSRSAGSWGQLPPDSLPDAILGEVSGFGGQVIPQLQLATTNDGNFVAAWEERSAGDGSDTQIFTALFMGRSRSWSPARLLVQRAPPQPQRDDGLRFPGQVRLERIASNAAGNTLVLWTEGLTADGSDTAFNRTRRALKAIRVNPAGASCSAVQVVDSALGGGAAGADLGIDPAGNAIAIWQQFESVFPGRGRRQPRQGAAATNERHTRSIAASDPREPRNGGSRRRGLLTALGVSVLCMHS